MFKAADGSHRDNPPHIKKKLIRYVYIRNGDFKKKKQTIIHIVKELTTEARSRLLHLDKFDTLTSHSQ